MVSIVYDHRAIPVYWQLLPKLGSSNLTEQIQIFEKVLPCLDAARSWGEPPRPRCIAYLKTLNP
ncbi:hypothetical protein [Moorena sp. SIO4G3]|uniref:hypothetical protein n=1 Tax=Moorena sp. SIO4G3 TaxID=2607821 RepID=UPI0025CC15F6|nr:hypothetical protein [Moorena sp. SIO4G3]